MIKIEKSYKKLLFLMFFVALLWNVPVSPDLGTKAYHLFLLFIATIIGAILRPLPLGAISIIGLTSCLFTKTLTIEKGLQSFGSKTVWLVVMAFLVAKGFSKTGLGRRLAYIFLSIFGKNSIGLGYSLVLTDFIFAPFVPSNTARGAGIIFPIVKSICEELGSRPHDGTEKKIGHFLMALSFQANTITSALFLTAMAANPLIFSIVQEFGLSSWNPTWKNWFILMIVPGAINLLLLPLIIFKLRTPEMVKTPQVIPFARKTLNEMGKMKFAEWVMAITFIILLVLWIVGSSFGIDATTATFIGLSILIITKVLSWNDILSEKSAFDALIWLSILLTMANQLHAMGAINWFSLVIKSALVSVPAVWAISILILIYYFSHYVFASMTAHVSSMFAAFVGVALSFFPNNPMVVWPFIVASNLCGGLTHYGTGSAPVFYEAGYLSLGQWWRVGIITGLINLAIWSSIGFLWWKWVMM